jgi:hypothetical protein
VPAWRCPAWTSWTARVRELIRRLGRLVGRLLGAADRRAQRLLLRELERAGPVRARRALAGVDRQLLLLVPALRAALARWPDVQADVLRAVARSRVRMAGLLLDVERTRSEQLRVRLVRELVDRGALLIVDRSGRAWRLDAWASMAVRTRVAEQGRVDAIVRARKAGRDLVTVTGTGSTHAVCRVWEGRRLSLDGRTAGVPTVAQARAAGLFHPNCGHGLA